MPIGKNAIKRVENNGYSNVKSEAPDMQNSHVIAAPDAQVVEKMIAPVETAAKKSSVKKSTKKTPVKTSVKNDAFARVSFGEEMPYYLL